jgi:DNA polymerase I-like protein with 3'-5' exonuclease and polymerase domains
MAAAFINMWAERSPKAWGFIERCRSAARKGSTLITPFGRKKRHQIVTRENIHSLQNEASNFPHQSIASDLTLDSAITAGPILRERDCWIVILMHDEILTEVPDDPESIEWARKTITDIMQATPAKWGITQIPFVAETEVGKRWGIYRKPDKGGKWAEYLRSKVHLVDRDVRAA